MSKLTTLVPVALLFAVVSDTCDVQAATPYYTTSYTVEVKYEMWRNGSTYWATEFKTDDRAEAEMMYELLLSAWDNGTICDVLGCGFEWIVVDIRLVPHRTYIQLKQPVYKQYPIYRW